MKVSHFPLRLRRQTDLVGQVIRDVSGVLTLTKLRPIFPAASILPLGLFLFPDKFGRASDGTCQTARPVERPSTDWPVPTIEMIRVSTPNMINEARRV